MIPKGTKGKAEIITYSPRAIERIEKTTPVMRNTYNFENTKATIQMQYRDRIAQKYLKSTTPATQLNEYFASVQDKSQMNLSNQVHSQLSVMRPPLNNNTHKHYGKHNFLLHITILQIQQPTQLRNPSSINLILNLPSTTIISVHR